MEIAALVAQIFKHITNRVEELFTFPNRSIRLVDELNNFDRQFSTEKLVPQIVINFATTHKPCAIIKHAQRY
jgi:hypothetical protein